MMHQPLSHSGPFKQPLSCTPVSNSSKVIDSPSWTLVFTFICHSSLLCRNSVTLQTGGWQNRRWGGICAQSLQWVLRHEHEAELCEGHLQGESQYVYLSLTVENHMSHCWSGSCMLPAGDDRTSNHVWATWEWTICWGNPRVTIFLYLAWVSCLIDEQNLFHEYRDASKTMYYNSESWGCPMISIHMWTHAFVNTCFEHTHEHAYTQTHIHRKIKY